jgi:hypothetical protein
MVFSIGIHVGVLTSTDQPGPTAFSPIHASSSPLGFPIPLLGMAAPPSGATVTVTGPYGLVLFQTTQMPG